MQIINIFQKQVVPYTLNRQQFEFIVSQELFSSAQVDIGTQRLLRSLLLREVKYTKVLDVGCGYGPLGIVLKRFAPEAQLVMIDRDALALEFALDNCRVNRVIEPVIKGSLGYNDVHEGDFDLIVSNIPAKVGPEVMKHLLLDAAQYLKVSGLVAVVVIDAVVELVAELLNSDDIEIVYHKHWPGHHVYHYRFRRQKAVHAQQQAAKNFDLGLYLRGQLPLDLAGKPNVIKTAFHLPDFDQLGISTQLLLKQLKKWQKKIPRNLNMLYLHPGQGIGPVGVWQYYRSTQIVVIDRDLLALKMTELNLIESGFDSACLELRHSAEVGSDVRFGLIVGALSEKASVSECRFWIENLEMMLEQQGMMIVVSSSTVLTRVMDIMAERKRLSCISRVKDHGKSVVLFSKKK